MMHATALKALACLFLFEGVLAKQDVVKQTGCRNKDVILNCPDFNETQSTVTLRWEVQDQKIASITNGKSWLTKKPKFQGRLTLYPNGSLNITSLKDGDESKYICIVQKKAITQLQVKSKGCHSSNISRQVCIEEVVLLDCQAKHRTDPKKIKELKWTKESEPGDWRLMLKLNKSPGVLSSKVQQLVNGSLLLPRGRDVGKDTYKCSVYKHDGEQTETHVVYVKNRRCTSTGGHSSNISRQVCIEEVVLLDCQAKHRTRDPNFKELKWTKKNESGDWRLVAGLNRSLIPQVFSNVQLYRNGSLLLPRGRDVGKDIYTCSVDKHDGGQTETHVVYVINSSCPSTGGVGAHFI